MANERIQKLRFNNFMSQKPRWYRMLRFFIALVKEEIRFTLKGMNETPLISMVKLWLQGFRGDKFTLYRLKEYKLNDYVSDFNAGEKLYSQNESNPSALGYLNNKVLFYFATREYLQVPKILSVVVGGDLLPVSKEHGIRDIESLKQYITNNKRAVLKPYDAFGGQGMYFVELKDDGFALNQKYYSTESFGKFLKTLDSFLISEFIIQANYSKEIYPETANTIRIYTFYDPARKQAFIHNALHRFGSKSSYPLDAYSRGGLFAEIDLTNGVLGTPYTRKGNHVVELTEHPDTKHSVKGTLVPHWDLIAKTVTEVSEIFGKVPFLGWDVLVTETGFYILEINGRPCHVFLQILKPALIDPRVKSIYDRL